jgi:hypothetical protein
VKPPGIDPGTVRLVAQRLNHYATPGSLLHCRTSKSIKTLVIVQCKDWESSLLHKVEHRNLRVYNEPNLFYHRTEHTIDHNGLPFILLSQCDVPV